MSSLFENGKRWILVPLALIVLALGVAACGDSDDDPTTTDAAAETAEATTEEATTEEASSLSGQLAGAGASAQEAAQAAWIADFHNANADVTISYDAIGSGGGREQFIARGVSFAGSDSVLSGDEREEAIDRCGPGTALQIPVYISPIAIIYNVEGVDSIQLSSDTLAGIFNQDITVWNDPAIAETNPGVDLPDTRITPVNRSDESGTTENFTDYLSKAASSVWTHEVSGDWPVPGGEAAQGTSGVVEAVGAGNGTIGYADASQAGDLGTVLVQVGDDFVGPDPAAAAGILDNSEEVDPDENIFSYDLDRDTDAAGTYPISLISYLIACTQYDSEDEAALVSAYLNYIISPEGQDSAAANAGSAPISDSLRGELQPIVDQIGA